MNIQDRLRHCAKHTGLDAVVELLTEAAAHIEGLNSIPKVQGGEPVPFLLNGTRFKMSFQTDLDADLAPITTLTCFNNFQNQLDGRWVALVAAEDDVHLKLSTPQPAQATQAEVTDEQIESEFQQCGGKWNGDQWVIEDADLHTFCRTILALRPQQSGLTGCNCRWDGDTQVQWCELHLAHKEAIHEWAERAKEAEKQLALRTAIQQAEAKTDEPVARVDYSERGNIAWLFGQQLPDGTELFKHPAPGVPDAVARDAERYRWLRASTFPKADQYPYRISTKPIRLPIGFDDQSTFDAAIDAAMLAAAQAQKGGAA